MQIETLLYNGKIYTMDTAIPQVEAIAIAGGRVAAIGNNTTITNLATAETRRINLGGRTVLPGFIDAHIHFLWYGLSLKQIDLMGVPALEQALETVARHAAQTPPGHWLSGRGWDQSLWPGYAFPTRHDLDRVTTAHPIFLRRKCGHAGWANSRALELAGITAATPDPDGGEIERDPATGAPTGILKENAMNLVARLESKSTPGEAMDAVRLAMQKVHRMGIVGIHNMEDAVALRAFQELREQGELTLRVVQQVPEAELDSAIALGLRSGFGDEWVRIGAVKIFSDGSLGARSALMIDPYEGEPQNYGIAMLSNERLKAQVEKAARAGLAVHIHAIGDQANRNVLNAIEATRWAGIGRHLRHRIEHAQVLHPDDVARFAELNVVASMQPIHATQDMLLADAHWGERARLSYAWSSLLSAGAALAFGSDAPVETPDVLQGLYAATTRRRAKGSPGPEGWYPEECLTLLEAIDAYTNGAACSVGMEKVQGSLTPGKVADLVVLDHDILAAEPAALLETEVLATMVGGTVVHGQGLMGNLD
ncbi:MAG: amidohydrolase [Chloroflexi bacterium]|nr:MAG: amidohydrolase [Chloroflexota bacterium]